MKPPKTFNHACRPPSGGGGITDSVVLTDRVSKGFSACVASMPFSVSWCGGSSISSTEDGREFSCDSVRSLLEGCLSFESSDDGIWMYAGCADISVQAQCEFNGTRPALECCSVAIAVPVLNAGSLEG